MQVLIPWIIFYIVLTSIGTIIGIAATLWSLWQVRR